MPKYWKNGFYLEQDEQNSRVEISDEQWEWLLDEQCNGKEITTDENGYPVAVERPVDELADKQYRLRELERKLTSTDYIFVKLAEYGQVGKTTEQYNVAQLHTEREGLRAEINVLRAEIAAMEGNTND